MSRLKIIIGSTRPGRKGPVIGEWINNIALEHPGFEVEILDLGDINLPMMDEPNHPRFKKYTQQHTKDWSAKIEEADAFIFVTSEYNHGFPAPLKNALDYLHSEWKYKTAAIVSYGGVSAGLRAAIGLKSVLTALGIMVIPEAVSIPFFTQFINDDNELVPNEMMINSAKGMFKELALWTESLKTLRESKAD